MNDEELERRANAELARQMITAQLTELREIVRLAFESENFHRSIESLRRWKSRVTKHLRRSVGEAEAEQFAEIRTGPFGAEDLFGDFQEEAQLLEGFLSALSEELAEHPWTIAGAQQASRQGEREAARPVPARSAGREVFVVHGHDERALLEVENFLRRGGAEPIILHQQPNEGRTIIEKFEDHAATVGFAVVLLTGDDTGYAKGPRVGDKSAKFAVVPKPRARQNVILELGFFMASLGRHRVCALYEEDVELPSDYSGVIFIPLKGDWKHGLARELVAAEIQFDLVKAGSI